MDVDVDIVFLPALTFIDERLSRKIVSEKEGEKSKTGISGLIPCTQCLARVNLWGRRQRYYDKYLELSIRNMHNEIVIPEDDRPFTWNRIGAANVGSYEDEVAYLTLSQAAAATRRFLRDYMAVSLHELQIPQTLFSAFASSRFERYYPLGKSPDLLAGLLPRSSSKALRTAQVEDVRAAAKWPVRGFSPFEGQLLALKRLADSGEPELALVGLMALVEWLLKDNLPPEILGASKRRSKAFEIFQKAQDYFQLPDGAWDILHAARRLRNDHVHERPTSRSSSYDPASVRYDNPETAKVFNAAVFAAFELFRSINLSRSAGKQLQRTSD
ncbi:hypothetical protein [Stappia sp.]|uniref:hypothetical protein n=1 Tax=Stappia sp. TaxID=1870903 RepID=UPI003A9949EB